MNPDKKNSKSPSAVFKVGAISLAFLIVGYQVALFVNKAAAGHVLAHRDCPDTVYVVERSLAESILGGSDASDGPRRGPMEDGASGSEGRGSGNGSSAGRGSGKDGGAGASAGGGDGFGGSAVGSGGVVIQKRAPHNPALAQLAPRRVESFRFDPNTASVEELVRLGFSEKQAGSIDNYRKKGGRFRRKSDFADSYVVADSVYKRLEPYISIPKIDINKADSAAFDSLPGIGGWFARKMVEYRSALHGYSCTEQLMEIYRFDREKYDALSDLVTCGRCEPYPLWSAPADSLRLHPHVRSWQTARAIVFYREHNPSSAWTVDGLLGAGIINEEQAAKMRRCLFE